MAHLRLLALAMLLLLAVTGAHPLPDPAPLPATAHRAADLAPELAGAARVTDGDTLRIGAARIRLFGVDAPESRQRCPNAGGGAWNCGAAATGRLQALVAGRTVRCVPQEEDRYGRTVATCSVDGRDLGAILVGEGLARAYVRYSDRYLAAEAEAATAGRGLWQGASEAPWEWRRARTGNPTATAPPPPRPRSPGTLAAATPDPSCPIKGNIAGDGRRLYHTPTMPSWARTRIDPGRGERYFCDEAAAEAAGWIPAAGGRTKP